jgi:hypothetical protein
VSDSAINTGDRGFALRSRLTFATAIR